MFPFFATQESPLIDLQYLPPDDAHAPYRVDMHFCDVIHPIYTNGEAWCLATMPRISRGLRVLKIYMYAAAMAMPEAQPLDMQGKVNYLSALMRGDAELFHWLNGFRAATNERKAEKGKPPNHAAMEQDSDAIDAADAADDDDKKRFLSRASVQQRIRIITDKQFVPLLIQTATELQDDLAVCSKLMQLIHLLMSERFVLTPTSFWRLHALDAQFFNTFTQSKTYMGWNEQLKLHAQQTESRIGEEGDIMETGDEQYFDEPAFLCREDDAAAVAAAAVQRKHDEGDSDDDSIAPPPAFDSDLPARIELDDDTVQHIFSTVQRCLEEGTPKSKLNALRMIMQLKPVVRHSEEKLRQCMPMLFQTGRKSQAIPLGIENVNVAVPQGWSGVIEGVAAKAPMFEAAAHSLGIRLTGASEVLLSAIIQQCVYLPGAHLRRDSDAAQPAAQHVHHGAALPRRRAGARSVRAKAARPTTVAQCAAQDSRLHASTRPRQAQRGAQGTHHGCSQHRRASAGQHKEAEADQQAVSVICIRAERVVRSSGGVGISSSRGARHRMVRA